MVKLRVEEGLDVATICAQAGIAPDTLFAWVRTYRVSGEAGLHPMPRFGHPGRKQCPDAVKDQIVELKREDPSRGVKRISQTLRRWFHLPASPETVRATLHERGLSEPKPVRAPKAAPKPRFFERSTPNQLWQADIFTFRLGGKNAYLIGYIDDYSRYIVGLGLYRSQTAEHVLETYRRAAGEYGVPREMLTDNGRQYTNWRGKTRFEQELAKDKVRHLRSRPHHPMTLGKIERFWQNIHGEFLCRAQFDSFEQAQERVRLWVKHYNLRRPHQGIGGLCPADRFFEIRNDLRKVIERGIEENLLETALRGKPQRPFYMVGRMDDQSVTMQAVKGKLVITTNDERTHEQQEVVCDLEQGEMSHEDGRQEDEDGAASVHGGGEVPGGAGAVDGAQLGGGAVPAAGGDLEPAQPVAGPGDGRDAAGAGAETRGAVREPAAERPAAGAADAEGGAGGGGGEPSLRAIPEAPEAGPTAAGPGSGGGEPACVTPELVEQVLRLLLAGGPPAGYGTGATVPPPHAEAVAPSAAMGGSHDRPCGIPGVRGPNAAADAAAAGGAQRQDHGRPGGETPGRVQEDLVRVAGAGPGGPAPVALGPAHGPPEPAARRGEGGDAPGAGEPGPRDPQAGGVAADPRRPA
jgi:transposase InsO family protein